MSCNVKNEYVVWGFLLDLCSKSLFRSTKPKTETGNDVIMKSKYHFTRGVVCSILQHIIATLGQNSFTCLQRQLWPFEVSLHNMSESLQQIRFSGR